MTGGDHDGGRGDGRWSRTAGRALARYVLLLLAAAACVLATGAFLAACKWLVSLL